jgi:hypothetical protein
MSLIDKAAVDRNFAEREAGGKQQMPGVIHATSDNVLMGRLTKHRFECSGEIA